MKTQILNKRARGIFLGMLVASILFLTNSCAQKIMFQRSSVVPAAMGTVKVKQDNNQNYNIEVEIQDLAEVERMQSPNQTYMVWMETSRGNTENLGQLKSSDSFFSKQKTAHLQTVSSYKPVKIFVTAEDETNVRYPDNQVILTTNDF